VAIPPDAEQQDEAHAARLAEVGARQALCPVLIFPGVELGERYMRRAVRAPYRPCGRHTEDLAPRPYGRITSRCRSTCTGMPPDRGRWTAAAWSSSAISHGASQRATILLGGDHRARALASPAPFPPAAS